MIFANAYAYCQRAGGKFEKVRVVLGKTKRSLNKIEALSLIQSLAIALEKIEMDK